MGWVLRVVARQSCCRRERHEANLPTLPTGALSQRGPTVMNAGDKEIAGLKEPFAGDVRSVTHSTLNLCFWVEGARVPDRRAEPARRYLRPRDHRTRWYLLAHPRVDVSAVLLSRQQFKSPAVKQATECRERIEGRNHLS